MRTLEVYQRQGSRDVHSESAASVLRVLVHAVLICVKKKKKRNQTLVQIVTIQSKLVVGCEMFNSDLLHIIQKVSKLTLS